MAYDVKEALTWPINELGEVIATNGQGTDTITGFLPSEFVPNDPAGRFALKFPDTVMAKSAANTLAIVGDSITAHWYTQSVGATSTFETKQYGYLAWAMNLSGHRLTIVSDNSMGGTYVTSAGPGTNFSAQLTAAIASGAGHLLLMGGLNDIENGVSLNAIKDAWKVLIARAIRAGMKIWWCTQSPIFYQASGGSYSINNQASNMAMNDWIKQYANSVNNSFGRNSITVVDLYAAAVDPSDIHGSFIPNGGTAALNDHPTNVASYYMGKKLAQVWIQYIPDNPQLVSSNADNFGYSTLSTNILDNGLFVNSSGGIATGFTVTNPSGGAGAMTNSIVARSDGIGNNQRQVITFASDNDSGRFNIADVKSRVNDGDWLVLTVEVAVSAATNLKNVRVSLTMNGAGIGAGAVGKSATCMQLDGTNDKNLPEGFTAVYKTPPIQYVAATMGALTQVSGQFSAFGSGVGGATLDYGRASIRKMLTI